MKEKVRTGEQSKHDTGTGAAWTAPAGRSGGTIRVLQFYRARERHEHSMEEMMGAVNRYLEPGGDRQPQKPERQQTPDGRQNQDGKPGPVGKEGKPELEIRKFYLPFGSYRDPLKMFWNIVTALAAFLIYRPDVCHITGEVTFLGCILPGKRTILTFHDFVYLDRWKPAGWDRAADPPSIRDARRETLQKREEDREKVPERNKSREKTKPPGKNTAEALAYAVSYLFWHWIPLRRCAAIVCVSDTIRDEMVRRFPFTESRITVIPNTLGENFERVLDACSESDDRDHRQPDGKTEAVPEAEENMREIETAGG